MRKAIRGWLFIPLITFVCSSDFELKTLESGAILTYGPRLNSQLIGKNESMLITNNKKVPHYYKHKKLKKEELEFANCKKKYQGSWLLHKANFEEPLTPRDISAWKTLRPVVLRMIEKRPKGWCAVSDLRQLMGRSPWLKSRFLQAIKKTCSNSVQEGFVLQKVNAVMDADNLKFPVFEFETVALPEGNLQEHIKKQILKKDNVEKSNLCMIIRMKESRIATPKKTLCNTKAWGKLITVKDFECKCELLQKELGICQKKRGHIIGLLSSTWAKRMLPKHASMDAPVIPSRSRAIWTVKKELERLTHRTGVCLKETGEFVTKKILDYFDKEAKKFVLNKGELWPTYGTDDSFREFKLKYSRSCVFFCCRQAQV